MHGFLGRLLSIIFIVALFSACATSHPASKEMELYAKEFSPPANKSFLYIARPASIVGGAVQLAFDINNSRIGPLGPGYFFMIELPPGSHTIAYGTTECRMPCDYLIPLYETGRIEIVTLPGRMYFFSVKPAGIQYYHHLADFQQISEQEGKKEVIKSDMAKYPYE